MSRIEEYLGMTHGAARDTILSRIRRYVEHETPSRDEARITALSNEIAGELRALGASVESIPAPGLGTNLVAQFTHDSQAAPILLLAHIDTVHAVGTLAQRAMRIDSNNEKAEGPGIYDMKAGVALLIEAVKWHHDRKTHLARPITMLITCDEEIGSHSSNELILEHARKAAAVLVPEPCMPDGGVKTARKGVATYRIDTTGRASHAGGDPGTAVSAITEMVHQAERILALADHSRGTTVNIGTISGGTATNVVAAHATAGVDVRLAVEGESERIDKALNALSPVHPETTVTVQLAENRPPLIRTAKVEAAYLIARACAEELGHDLSEGTSGGGSDGSIAAATGVAVLDGLGPRGGGAHAVDEHVLVNDLPFRLALLCRLLERL